MTIKQPEARDRLPTLAQFITKAQIEFCVEIESHPVANHEGEHLFADFRRTGSDGKRMVVPVPNIAEHEHLTAEVLAHLCRRLDLKPFQFGLFIG